MLKRVAHSLGLVEQTDKDPRRKNQLKGSKASPDYSLQGSKKFYVRIVHAGGKEELYQHAILVSKLMEKYPGMCVARPEVFKSPHQSVLWPEEHLLPGQKYIIISYRDVEKLKRKLSGEAKTKEPSRVAQELLKAKSPKSPNGHIVRENLTQVPDGVRQEKSEAKTSTSPLGHKIEENGEVIEGLDAKAIQSLDGGTENESFGYAKDFYVSKEKPTRRYPKRKGIKGKRPFVPPLPRVRSHRGLGWQPSLPTVLELSP